MKKLILLAVPAFAALMHAACNEILNKKIPVLKNPQKVLLPRMKITTANLKSTKLMKKQLNQQKQTAITISSVTLQKSTALR